MSTEHELPPVSGVVLALGHLMRALEHRFPGMADAWVASLEDEYVFNKVRDLRSPDHEPALREARHEALLLARHIRIVILADLAAGKPRPADRPKRR